MTKQLEVPQFKTYKPRRVFHTTNNIPMTEDKEGQWVSRSDAEYLADLLQQSYKRMAELESQNLTTSNALLDAGKKIAELEASQLAVKLTHHAIPLDAATAIRACMDEFPEAVRDVVEECAVIAENTIRAAGGTVGGE